MSNRNVRYCQLCVAAVIMTLTIDACSSHQSTSNISDQPTNSSATAVDAPVKVTQSNLDAVITDYKAYVAGEVNKLADQTKVFTDAIKAGDLHKAQSLYAGTREHYERIEPVAELFSDLDGAIDARADDYSQKEKDPKWTGFHRIEMTLFQDRTTQGLAPLANKLMKDVSLLKAKVATLKIEPKVMVGGTGELVEEMSSKKITGEEDRYSGADLSDFQANLDGSKKIVDLLREQVHKSDPNLLTRIDENFNKIDTGIAKYKTTDGIFNGYVNYKKLTESDRKALQSILASLAEDLSLLRGTLGVS